MTSLVFARAKATAQERWISILGSVALVFIVMVVVMAIMIPMLGAAMSASVADATSVSSATSTTSLDPTGTTDPFASSTVGTPAPTPVTVAQPDMTKFLALIGIMAVLIGVLSIAAAVIGATAAAGASAMDAFRTGLGRTPAAIVQTIKLAWMPLAANAVALAAGALTSPWLAIAIGLVGFVLWLRVYGTVMLALGAVAHGHDSYSTDVVRSAVEGRAWSATGVAIVGMLAGGVLAMIPLIGSFIQLVWTSSFTSAMWEEFGDGAGPATPGIAPVDGGSAYASSSAYAPVASSSGPFLTGGDQAPAAVAAVPPVVGVAAVPAPAPQAPQLVAGPSWQAAAAPTEPAGAWIQLAAPGRVALQPTWDAASPAPALHLADAAGTWRTPAEQPSASGAAIWLELPAGATWVALVPAAPQQLSCTSWLPAAAGGSAGVAA